MIPPQYLRMRQKDTQNVRKLNHDADMVVLKYVALANDISFGRKLPISNMSVPLNNWAEYEYRCNHCKYPSPF